jgi:archaellum component FlaC
MMTEDTAKNVDAVRIELGTMINQVESELAGKIDKLEKKIDDKFGIVFQTIEAIDRELQPLVLNYTKMGAALNQSIILNGKVFHEFDLRLTAVENKVDRLDKKVDGLQKQVDGLQKQVDGLQKQVDGLGSAMAEGFASINKKLDRLFVDRK